MRVVIRAIANTEARRVMIAEAEVVDGRWIEAAERAINNRYGYEGSERRHLVADTYLGGSFAQPFGLHTVFFARYDPVAVAYRYDERVRLEVVRG